MKYLTNQEEVLSNKVDRLEEENKLLQGKLLSFRNELVIHSPFRDLKGSEAAKWLHKFDKHFNIKVETNGN